MIRAGLPSIPYQKITLANPQYVYNASDNQHTLILRDAIQQIEVKVNLNVENLKDILRQLTR
ncbi:MAG: hypothetical protein KME23_16010 [Goleter apudmare HA4340-LM2]|nr:hypothetical protein [Goleter apudmare HA4340-LM2]